MKKLQIDSLDFNTEGGINWTIVQEILGFKTDTLLIHYLSKINQRIIEIADERGQTLLHYAVSLENSEAVYSLVKFAREVQNESQADIEEWINSKTYMKSFTPL
jgi:ankyrin repeat protein